MASFVTLASWTDQGARNVKDTVARARETLAAVAKAGGKMTLYWTQGRYDLVAFSEGLDEEFAAAYGLISAKSGFLRTETLRAFTIDEMERIVKKVP